MRIFGPDGTPETHTQRHRDAAKALREISGPVADHFPQQDSTAGGRPEHCRRRRVIRPAATVVSVTEKTVEIREFREGDLETVVEFSLRAWAPVFASVRNVLGDDIFLRLHPDWQASQAE
ncbi:MAG: hypothetical protein QOG21_315, partial [Actinomycetota bacterium]|nr:hypothetical protein [Actinomycetota bacterium]